MPKGKTNITQCIEREFAIEIPTFTKHNKVNNEQPLLGNRSENENCKETKSKEGEGKEKSLHLANHWCRRCSTQQTFVYLAMRSCNHSP